MQSPEGGWLLEAEQHTGPAVQMSVLHSYVHDQDYDCCTLAVECPITMTPAVMFPSSLVSVTDISNGRLPASGVPAGMTRLSKAPDGKVPFEDETFRMVPTMAVSCPVPPLIVESEKVCIKKWPLRNIPISGVHSCVIPIGELSSEEILMAVTPSDEVLGTAVVSGGIPMVNMLAGSAPVMNRQPESTAKQGSAELLPVKEDSTFLVPVIEDNVRPFLVVKEFAPLNPVAKESPGLNFAAKESNSVDILVDKSVGTEHLTKVSADLHHVVNKSADQSPLAETHSLLDQVVEELARFAPELEEHASVSPVEQKPVGLILMEEVPTGFIPMAIDSTSLVPVAKETTTFVPVGGELKVMPALEEPAGLVLAGKEASAQVPLMKATTILLPGADKAVGLATVNEMFAGMGLVTGTCVSGMLIFEEMASTLPYTASVLAWNAADLVHAPLCTREKDANSLSIWKRNKQSSFWTSDHIWASPMEALNGIKPGVVPRTLRMHPYSVCGGVRDGRMKKCTKSIHNSPLVRQNAELVSALQELEHRCNTLKEENNILRKNSFPETDEKVKRLKKKNAELAVIAKRLEERAQKLQEANLKVVNTPLHLKGSSIEVCKKAFARQRAKDLAQQASALLSKDKQIEALQQECRELKAKLAMGKECTNWLNLSDFDRLLRESQKEVLRLQRQIAIKYLKESLHLSKVGSHGSSPSAIVSLGASAGVHIIDTSALSAQGRGESAVTLDKTFSGNDAKELELCKKRKECENLEQEVRKKQRRCEELETILKEVKSEHAKLLEENSRLGGRVAWTDKVESENVGLRDQLAKVTEKRDSAIQEIQQLQSKLENLEQVLKHMREVAERRQHLEKEHEDALIALRGRQDEVKRLHQAHVEAKKEHEGAVHLLEVRVKDLEEKCRSQTKQFSLLSQELERFRLHTGKIDLFPSTLVTSELPITPCCSTPEHHRDHQEKDPSSSWDVISWGDVRLAESWSSFVYLSLSDVPMPTTPCADENKKDGIVDIEGLYQAQDGMCNIGRFAVEKASITSENEINKLENLHSSPKSISQNSSKSCPTPEVDTASEMEELDVDSVSLMPEPDSRASAKLQVFLARYSYNPFDGPNENPEAELPLTAGEYIYIYGEMDDDGFYEGELMDGRRGLVPSNFVERVSDDDLMTFQPPEVSELSHSSCQDISFMSSSSVERKDLPEEEGSMSPLLNSLKRGGEEPTDISAVPYPRKLTLIKQLARSVVVGWEPPLVPAGCGSIQSYNIYLDTELRQNVRCGSPTKALIEKLDLKTKAYRVSVQCVTECGNSDRLRCTLLVGHGYSIAPSHLRVRSLTSTSAEISWQPSNSNYTHALYLNEEEYGFSKAGTYWYAFRNLRPCTQYNVKVESRPHRTPWELPPERREHKSTVMQLTTPSAGPPDAPLDVQVELGPSPGILLISWLPVTIDAAGTSNGVPVTGYAVYADGQKVLEVTSPTAGSVLLGMSHLQLLQVSREVSVRTMSPHGESVDSVPAQIPSALLKVPDSLFLLNSSLVSEPPFGEYLDSQSCRITRTRLTSSPYTLHTSSSNAKLTNNTISNEFEVDETALQTKSPLGNSRPLDSSPLKVSQNKLDSTIDLCTGHPNQVASQDVRSFITNAPKEHIQEISDNFSNTTTYDSTVGLAYPPKFCEVSAVPIMASLEGIDSNLQEKSQNSVSEATGNPCKSYRRGQKSAKNAPKKSEAHMLSISEELLLITSSEQNCETEAGDFELKKGACQTWSAETLTNGGMTSSKQSDEDKSGQTCSSPETALSECGADYGNKAIFQRGSVQEFLELSSEEKVVVEEPSFKWPSNEVEEREPSTKDGGLFASANRSSDLSDILEEEEEDLHTDVPTVKRFGQKVHGKIIESRGKIDACETDSDEEVLERILELPLQKHCSKKLFSIPEVTEEEDDDDENGFASQETGVNSGCIMENQSSHTAEVVSFLNLEHAIPKSFPGEPDGNVICEASCERLLDNKDDFYHDERNFCIRKSGCLSDHQESSITYISSVSSICQRKTGCKAQGQPHCGLEITSKCTSNVKEHCSRMLSNCNYLGKRRSMQSPNEEHTSCACDVAKNDTYIVKLRQRFPPKRLHSSCLIKPTIKATSPFQSKGMEINIEYDTEDEDEDGLTTTPTFARQPRSNCSTIEVQGYHECCSDCSSNYEPTQSNQQRMELTRQETLEDDEGTISLSDLPVMPSRWSGLAQSQKELSGSKRDLKDSVEGLSMDCSKIISKEKYQQHENDISDVLLSSRICVSKNKDQRLQPSFTPTPKHGLTRKMKIKQATNYSEQDDLKGWPSEELGIAALDMMKDMKNKVASTVVFEGVKSCKKSFWDETLRLFVALFEYDPVTMSPNTDAAYEELPFKEGQIIKVFGDKDADGFYKGECDGKIGYIPCNMVSEIEVESEDVGNHLLQSGFLTPKTSMENLEGINTLPPTPNRLAVPPPKPRRSKKALAVSNENTSLSPEPRLQVCRTELNLARTMVAIFDYNPRESSPNVDVEAELPFTAGDIITVYGSMDDDGFYYGELRGQQGLVPSNFLEVFTLPGEEPNQNPSQDVDSQGLRKERQLYLEASAELTHFSPDSPEDLSHYLSSQSTPEQVELHIQSKKKKGLFSKGRTFFKKLGSSKKY
ncbi:peripheral-type benzodiazepine receptor-associated protein 1 isoform X3 [Ambystoma mexicanum]|uniref:peripheral-type benzodiazepine receptor-associated protein 1 isoform X3 n=1 Tax=Ambystoma mexicanum TaxID=8296 RepID=UPI0037E96591